MFFSHGYFIDIWSERETNMHEHVALVSKGAATGSVLNNLMMNAASFPFITCTFDTIWSVALKLSCHSVKNKLLSFDSESRSGHRMSIIAS